MLRVESLQKKYPENKGGFRSTTGTVSCYRCGNNHMSPDCPHKDVTCKRCRKRGHFARFCKTKLGKRHTKNFNSSKPTAGVVKLSQRRLLTRMMMMMIVQAYILLCHCLSNLTKVILRICCLITVSLVKCKQILLLITQ